LGMFVGGMFVMECMLVFPTLFYIPARILLIVLPVIELVQVVQGCGTTSIANSGLSWTRFIPHI
jgi:hypothetical protein